MSPTPIQSQPPAVRAPIQTASSSHRRHPLVSALPLLSTIAATLLLAVIAIVMTAMDTPVASQASNLLLA
jgi:hypothetical protein